MRCHVYILRCADGSLYVGVTRDLENRVSNHQAGSGCAYTSSRRPVSLAYSEPHPTFQQAYTRERQLKRWTRAKKEALIEGDLQRLKRL